VIKMERVIFVIEIISLIIIPSTLANLEMGTNHHKFTRGDLLLGKFFENSVMTKMWNNTDAESPYEWTWYERVFCKHELKVITYDISENKTEDKINVIIFNFGV
jgi:hypothetical protein